MHHSTLQVRISRIGRTIEHLHDRLHHLAPSQRAEALHVRTRLSVLTRCLKVLRAERERRGMKKVREQRTTEAAAQRWSPAGRHSGTVTVVADHRGRPPTPLQRIEC